MPKRYENTAAANLVDAALRASPRSAREVAASLGLRPNVISMVRTGALALPAGRCAPVARALGIAPHALMAACLRSYPDNRAWQAVRLATDLREG